MEKNVSFSWNGEIVIHLILIVWGWEGCWFQKLLEKLWYGDLLLESLREKNISLEKCKQEVIWGIPRHPLLTFQERSLHLFLFDLVYFGGVTKLKVEIFFELIVTDALF